MRLHPLTPMTDANLVRVLQAQCRRSQVGLLEHGAVRGGADAARARLDALRAAGCAFAIADAIDDADLRTLAAASREMRLVVAGSGLAIGIPALHGFQPSAQASRLPPPQGARAVVSGSCSAATNAQVAAFIAAGGAAFQVDPLRIAAGDDVAAQALSWARPLLGDTPLLVYATAQADAVRDVQSRLGAQQAGALVEDTLSRIAQGLVALGVGQLVVAGGETAGACVQRLGIATLRIGPQIDPGVPWCHASRPQLHLALKSGNFGAADFFTRAFAQLA
jgi:3-dehydrotetronate 4-kinase